MYLDKSLGPEAMDGAVFHTHGNDPDTCSLVHDQVERKVLNEVCRVVAKRLHTHIHIHMVGRKEETDQRDIRKYSA